MKRLLVTGLAAVAALLAVAPAASAVPTPLGRACAPHAGGVRFCEGTAPTRVPSHDGVPLDVDVTLPATGDGPFPTLVMLHGWGGSKDNFESDDPTGGADMYSNVWFAKKGYAVVNYSARGFGGSCGTVTARNHPGCVRGWLHLGDQRYEVRDTQFLLGLLVDQGIAKPDALGVTGVSYGGGQSMMLAYLNDRIRDAQDNRLKPWRSPKGTPLRIAAAWPRWPWSDLVYSLVPNGRFRDFERSRPDEALKPIGIPKQSYISALYALGSAAGFYAPPGVDPTADITTWFAQINRGEPETADQRALADEIHNHHSAFGLTPSTAGTAPLLIQEGWTDDLFPAPEALRAYNDVRARGGNVALQLADIGHARGQNKQPVDVALNGQAGEFLDRHLRGTGTAPAPGSVVAYTQTCPGDAPAGGPFRSSSWAAMTPGAVRQGFGAAKTVSSEGGDPQAGTGTDPIAAGDACASFAAEDAPGTAVYRLPLRGTVTMIGLPTIQADIRTQGVGGQLDARLWDVGPDGQQILVSRGGYRLTDNQTGRVLFQLQGNAYKLQRGHTARLELTGRDAPYLRPSNGPFSIEVSNLTLELPVRERPGAAGGTVVRPVLGEPSAGRRGSGRKRLRVTVKPRRVRAGQRKRFRIVVRGRACARCKLRRVRGSRVRFGARTYRLRGSKKTVTRRFRKRGLVRVRATKRGYRSSSIPVRVMRRKR